MRIGRIPYINCYPVYGAIDRGIVSLAGDLIDGVPSVLNEKMAAGLLDLSVVSAVEYARDSRRYLLLPDLAISCDGPVRSVLLFSRRPASELGGRRIIVSRSSMTSVALLELMFENVWRARPDFVPGDSELADIAGFAGEEHEARLVIGDAALMLSHAVPTLREAPTTLGDASPALRDASHTLGDASPAPGDGSPALGDGARSGSPDAARYPYVYDLGHEWKQWTGLPFVFAVWVAQRSTAVPESLGAHASLILSRDWGLQHLPELAEQASAATGVGRDACSEYFRGLDYGLGYEHLAGLTEFFRRLVAAGRVPNGSLAFLPAA